MRLRDLTCPLHEMAAFNYLKGSDDVVAFYPNKAGRIPTTVVFPLDGRPSMAHNFIVLSIRPKVGNDYKWSLVDKKKVPGATLTDAEQVFLKIWYEMIPHIGGRMFGELPLRRLAQQGILTQLFPNVFKAVTINGRDKLYHHLVTQGLDHGTFTQYLGDIPKQQAQKQGEMIHNATVFFPANLRPKRKQMLIQFLDAAYGVLQRNGIGNLFAGPITFAKLPGNTAGDWDHKTGNMRVQPNTQNDKSNLFTIIHEYGHKYWDQAMNEAQRQAVKEKYIERSDAGDQHQADESDLMAVYQAAEEIIQPGIQVQFLGRGKKFAGTWEITSVFPWMNPRNGVPTKKYSARREGGGPTMGGPVAALMDKKKWKILNADAGDAPDLSSVGQELKADIVSDQWFPTKYSESKYTEWWSELFGLHMLGNLKGEPAAFMNQVMGR